MNTTTLTFETERMKDWMNDATRLRDRSGT